MTALGSPHTTQAVLLSGGVVHAPGSPRATALLTEGDTVSWIGSDSGGRALAPDGAVTIDLAGRLVTPPFVDAARWPDGADDAAYDERLAAAVAAGVTALVVTTHDPAAAAAFAARSGPEHGAPLVAVVWDDPPADADRARELVTGVPSLVGFAVDAGEGSPDDLARHVAVATGLGLPVVLRADDEDAVGAALAALSAVADRDGLPAVQGSGHVLLLGAAPAAHGAAGDAVAELLRLGASVQVDPVAVPDVDCAALAAAGVPVVFAGSGTAQEDPWARVRAAAGDRPGAPAISARAAFRAHSRAMWRVLRDVARPGAGTLAPGSPASAVLWSRSPLAVEAPDDRVQTWSTDPRSGTPPLPALGSELPRPEGVLLDGTVLGDPGTDGSGPGRSVLDAARPCAGSAAD